MQTSTQGLSDSWQAEVSALELAVNTALTTYAATFNGDVTAFVTSVNTALSAQTTANTLALNNETAANTLAMANLTTFVNNSVASIINANVEIQDPIVAGILNDSTSDTRTALNTVLDSVAVSDPMVHSALSDTSGTSYALVNTMADSRADAQIIAKDHFINVKDHGAVGDGVTDDTVAIQNAIALGGITFFPSGTYIVSNLQAVSGMRLRGVGLVGVQRSRLRATVGSVFTTGSTAVFSTDVSGLVLDSFGGGGDVLTGLWSLGRFDECSFVQYQSASSCLNVTGWIDMLTTRCTFDHVTGATVSTIIISTNAGEVAQSTFISTRISNPGKYAVTLEGIGGSVIENITFRDTNVENPTQGGFNLLSCRHVVIENAGFWDMHTVGSALPLVRIGKSTSAGALVSTANEITHYLRDASLGPAPDIYDITLINAECEMTLITQPRHQTTSLILLDLGSTSGLLIADNTNMIRSDYFTIVSTFSLRPPIGAAIPATGNLGSIRYDVPTSQLVASNGTNWLNAAGTVVP
jgi:hypothetical protein